MCQGCIQTSDFPIEKEDIIDKIAQIVDNIEILEGLKGIPLY